MALTSEQLREILEAHCQQVIDGWDEKTLVSFAFDKMMESFGADADKVPGVSNVVVDDVLEDVFNHFGETDDAVNFLKKFNLDKETIDTLPFL